MYEGGLPIAARSTEMWFTTNTIISAKKRARLKKEESVKGKKGQNPSMLSRSISGKGPETSTGGCGGGAGRVFGAVGVGSEPEGRVPGIFRKLERGAAHPGGERA